MPTDSPPESITALLFPGANHDYLQILDTYRLKWEAEHGPTDLTKYYVSRWPVDEQNALYSIDFDAFLASMPRFFQDYTREIMQRAAQRGKIDDMPIAYITAYCKHRMRRDDSDRSR